MEFGLTAHNPSVKHGYVDNRSFTKKHSLCKTQSNDLYINITRWKLGISKTEIRYDYKQNGLVYNARVLPCSYKNKYCELTAQFPASIISFQNHLCFVFFSHQFRAKITIYRKSYWVVSLRKGQNAQKFGRF